MPRLHVVRAFSYSLDGFTRRQAAVAETLDLPEKLARGLLAERFCIPAGAPAAVRAAPVPPAPAPSPAAEPALVKAETVVEPEIEPALVDAPAKPRRGRPPKVR